MMPPAAGARVLFDRDGVLTRVVALHTERFAAGPAALGAQERQEMRDALAIYRRGCGHLAALPDWRWRVRFMLTLLAERVVALRGGWMVGPKGLHCAVRRLDPAAADAFEAAMAAPDPAAAAAAILPLLERLADEAGGWGETAGHLPHLLPQ